MSWAANNVEAFDNICIEGVTEKLIDDLVTGDADRDEVALVVMTIASECPRAFSELVVWANREVSEAHSDFLLRRSA